MKTTKAILLLSFVALGGCATCHEPCNMAPRVVCTEAPVYNPPRDCHTRYLPNCNRSYRGDRSYNSGY